MRALSSEARSGRPVPALRSARWLSNPVKQALDLPQAAAHYAVAE
jgi:hypothetical protein